MLNKQALLIHENPGVRQTVKRVLGQIGWQTNATASHAEGWDYFGAYPCPDLVLLGLSTAIAGSMETFTAIRESVEVPVIVLASQENEDECLIALERGAADYILTPIKENVLVARVRALFRRDQGVDRQGQHLVFCDDNLTIDLDQGRVFVRGTPVRLSNIEHRLLAYLLQNRGCVLTHSQILANIWGWEFQEKVEYVHVYISHLRQKLEADPRRPRYLLTEFGVGYRFLPSRRGSTEITRPTL